jgi:hypothetical protein
MSIEVSHREISKQSLRVLDTNIIDHNAIAKTALDAWGVYLLGFDPLQGNMPFQHQDRMAFSPFSTDLLTVDNAFLMLMFVKALKQPDGVKMIQGLASKYMDTTSKIVSDIMDSGNTTWMANGNATMLASAFLHRQGLLDDGGCIRVQEHVRGTFDKMFTMNFVTGSLGALSSLTKTIYNGTAKSKSKK